MDHFHDALQKSYDTASALGIDDADAILKETKRQQGNRYAFRKSGDGVGADRLATYQDKACNNRQYD